MSRLLICTMPAVGHVNPILPIARALVERGHDVRWYTSTTYRERIEATGAQLVPMTQSHAIVESDPDVAFPERSRLGPVGKLKFDLKYGFADAGPGQLRDLEALRDEFIPDLLIADPTFVGAGFYYERYGVPFATMSVLPLPIGSRDTAPFGLGILPNSSPLGRLRNRALKWAVEHMIFADVQRHWNKVRVDAGFRPLKHFVMDSLSPFLYLQPTVPSFEYPRSDLPPQIHFIGPVLPKTAPEWTPPDWWDELRSGKPVVHVTQGTIATDGQQLLAPTINALANEELLLVVTTGGKPVETLPVAKLPANVRVASFIPHIHLLPHVDVMVTNGGYGGVQMALANGVPLIVAGASEDKPEVANRVAWAGAGINLRTATPTPEQVRTAVRTVIHDPRYRTEARRLQAEYATYDAAERATALLEQLATTGKPVLRPSVAAQQPGTHDLRKAPSM